MAAEGAHVHRNGAEPLRAVEQDLDTGGGERGRVEAAARDPRYVRAGHQPGVGADEARQLVEGRDREPHAARVASGGERPEYARVLLVARHDLVARVQVEGGEHRVDPVGRRAGESDLAGLGVQEPRHSSAQLLAARHHLLHEGVAGATLLQLQPKRPLRGLERPARHRPVGPGIQVGQPLEHGELGAKALHGRLILGCTP